MGVGERESRVLELVSEILRRTGAGERVALATLVRARGSTPQKAGAAMLVLASGKTLGTLGGGCTEAETRVRALRALSGGEGERGALHTYKLDHDFGWDDGLVCGGIMEVAVHVLGAGSAVVEGLRSASDALARREAATVRLPDPAGGEAFEFAFEPTPRLVLAGAGHVALSVARVAAEAGFEVTVIDDRADMASPERFPGATRVVGDIARELARSPFDAASYVVIVTRGHRHDAECLRAVVGSGAKYVGLIGSKRKIRTILGLLAEEGVPREKLLAVHAPVGLEIGAVSPGEIAVSIVAELVAARRGRGVTPMSMKMPGAEVVRWLDRDAATPDRPEG